MPTDRDVVAWLAQLEPVILAVVRRRLPDLGEHDREDVLQDLRLHLWQHSLPRFDARRGVRVTTYGYACASNWCRAWARTAHRRSRRAAMPLEREPIQGPDQVGDDRRRAAAGAIRQHGAGVLTARQLRLVRTVAAEPDATDGRLARRLGYGADVAAFRADLGRVCERVESLDVLSLPPRRSGAGRRSA